MPLKFLLQSDPLQTKKVEVSKCSIERILILFSLFRKPISFKGRCYNVKVPDRKSTHTKKIEGELKIIFRTFVLIFRFKDHGHSSKGNLNQ
jgi:hypothetical protein